MDAKEIISKELLSAVLGAKYELSSITIKNDLLECNIGMFDYECDIYNIAYQCKDWAFDLGFTIETYKKIKLERPITFIKIYCNKSKRYAKELELAKTELHEADFKACQWILDNKETK